MNNRKEPLVSIITASYNNEDTIRDTIESILNQSYNNIEYIFVDGLSKDRTLDIINDFEDQIVARGFKFKLLSEKDNGIADAWNKGIKLSRGEVIGFLNSDDWYERTAIEKAIKQLDVNKPQISYGICKRVDSNKNVTDIIQGRFIPLKLYFNFGFSHTTCFKTSKVYQKIGLFDTNFKIGIDTDLLLRAYKHKVDFIQCDNVTFMREGGVSLKFKELAEEEYIKALYKNKFKFIGSARFIFKIIYRLKNYSFFNKKNK